MGRKKKQKKVTLATVRNYSPGGESVTTYVADHTVAREDLPFGAQIMTMEFEDPWADRTTDGKVERALNTVSTRNDVLAHMYATRQITARQFAAGRKWESSFEIVEGRGRSLVLLLMIDQDPTIERATVQVQAANELRNADAVLGFNAKFVRMILGGGCTVQEAAGLMGWDTYTRSDDMRILRGVFKMCLEALADFWGLA